MITICPHLMKSFGATAGVNFYVFTDSELQQELLLKDEGAYRSCQMQVLTGDLMQMIQATVEPAHILVMCRNQFISSVDPACLGQRKLATMAANSTPTSIEQIQHFINIAEKTDPVAQRVFADNFFANLEATNEVQIIDERYGTSATFVLEEDNEWFEQGGPIEWGQEQLIPSGEVSVLPMFHGRFDASRRLAINGEIALQGFPIVHSGQDAPWREEQEDIYQDLATLKVHAIIATVEDGRITSLRATHPDVKTAKQRLEFLFNQDENYRTIWEMGMGIHTQHDLWPGNAAMNEVYGGERGVVHWGLGLTPFTRYHIDILCPYTRATIDVSSNTRIFEKTGKTVLELGVKKVN